MPSKYPSLNSKDLKFIWYEPIRGVENTGGLGMRFTRPKKTRSFFALLTPDQVTELHAFLSEQLKLPGKKAGR